MNALSQGGAPLRIAVAIPTFRRPHLLAGLLENLPARVAEVEGSAVVDVIVVDNDPEGTARSTVTRFAHERVRYVHEPRPGIAHARNAALVQAHEADVVAFIDDDERPRPQWLASLVATWVEYRPAAVMGRVISVFENDPDPWVLEAGTFTRRPRPTGLQIPVAAAGNLLVDVAQVRDRGVWFDTTLGLGGGEDSLFSRELVRAGGRIVWCNESEAEDLVPLERTTRTWAMKRAFNGGSTAVVVDLRLAPTRGHRLAVRARALVGGAARTVLGLGQHGLGRLRGDLHADARGLRTSYRGRGMAAAAVGRAHEHYARSSAT
jgi:succinoglycan biosynthesis protein ExoM